MNFSCTSFELFRVPSSDSELANSLSLSRESRALLLLQKSSNMPLSTLTPLQSSDRHDSIRERVVQGRGESSCTKSGREGGRGSEDGISICSVAVEL
jgi:hypothetical protein